MSATALEPNERDEVLYDEPVRHGSVRSSHAYYMLAFKMCLDEDDHWLNKLAVWSTSSHLDETHNFEGMVSHVEILFHVTTQDNRPAWYRYSIMKSRGKQHADGKVVWKPGVVHRIKTDPTFNSKYRFYKVEAPIDEVNAALRFVEGQVGAPFNFYGYVLNFYFPFKIGVRNHREANRRRNLKWFCSEFVVCAVQAAGMHEMQLMKACAVSPNELFRMVSNSSSCKPIMAEAYIRGDNIV